MIRRRLLSSRGSITILEAPTKEKAVEAIKSALSRRRTLMIVGNCWVNYQGRARSILNPGERILIIKEDGSVLVHRPRGYEPVNWQPPGCIFHFRLEGDLLFIKAVRRKPRETLKIFFDKIYLLAAMSLADKGEFFLHASEEEMQKAIINQPSLIEEGLRIIAYEKKVEPGFMDVYGVDRDGRLVVIEIKRRTAGKEAVFQLSKYVNSLRGELNRRIRGILVAPKIARQAHKTLITLGLEFKRLDPKKCAEVLAKRKLGSLEEYY
ncbi:endonuclease NucS [Candidatus Bathyarchaeota archaeon]|nr:MAG: endonuclease NucS [Candidatus Bathyarchaeota archaeon]